MITDRLKIRKPFFIIIVSISVELKMVRIFVHLLPLMSTSISWGNFGIVIENTVLSIFNIFEGIVAVLIANVRELYNS